jgi:phosphopantetheinyl transferase
MPIFFQQDIDEETKLAVWKIEEDESFFTTTVDLHREITHTHKRLQHLAGRYLLNWLYPSFPLALIQIADTRKPFLHDEAYHFSISHCGEYAAVIVSKGKRVGIDIEKPNDVINKIKNKFLNEEEMRSLDAEVNIQQLTHMWSCKETVFKWYGKGNVDFRKHIQIKKINDEQMPKISSVIWFTASTDIQLQVQSVLFKELCLSWIATDI